MYSRGGRSSYSVSSWRGMRLLLARGVKEQTRGSANNEQQDATTCDNGEMEARSVFERDAGEWYVLGQYALYMFFIQDLIRYLRGLIRCLLQESRHGCDGHTNFLSERSLKLFDGGKALTTSNCHSTMDGRDDGYWQRRDALTERDKRIWESPPQIRLARKGVWGNLARE